MPHTLPPWSGSKGCLPMTRTKNRAKRNDGGWYSDNFWQSANFNGRAYQKNLFMLVSLAMNRFRWVGLPDTCDERFLEYSLLRNSYATICHEKDMPDVWQTLQAAPSGDFNAYGIPVRWEAVGMNGTRYSVDDSNGELIYYSFSRVNPWNALEIYARKLTHYERTEDINLSHQHKPWVFIAPQEKKLELTNLLKQVSGGEPAILGDGNFSRLVDEVKAIDTKVPLVVEDLARAKQNVLNDALLYLGIPHLAFEKGERMIEDEARANTAPTNIMLLDCLQARRQACKALNERFGLDLHVYFNDDLESYNFNYTNNIESMAQDGALMEGSEQ